MNSFPREIEGAQILEVAELNNVAYPSWRLPCDDYGRRQERPTYLAIAGYPDEESVYLFGVNANWEVLWDSACDSVAQAKRYAANESAAVTKLWKRMNDALCSLSITAWLG